MSMNIYETTVHVLGENNELSIVLSNLSELSNLFDFSEMKY